MSNTPRTDLESKRVYDDEQGYPESYDVSVAFLKWSRQLERELAAANRKIQRLVEIGDRLAMAADENPYNGIFVTQWNDERTAAKEEKAS